ncbi:MAG: methyl-accepting chemotaxis protein [Bacillota bacterium]
MELLEVIHQRNSFLLKVLWPLFILGAVTTAFLTPELVLYLLCAGVPMMGLLTFLIIKRRLVYMTMYLVLLFTLIIAFVVCYLDPNYSSYCLVFLCLVIVSLYQDIRPVLMSGILMIGLTNYFYFTYGEKMFPRSGLNDLVFFNVYIVFIVILLMSQIRFGEKLRNNIQNAIDRIREFSKKLKDGIKTASGMSKEVTDSFQEIAASVESQAGTVADIKGAMNSNSQSVQSVVRDSVSLSTLSAETNREISDGNHQIKVLAEQIDGMQAIINDNTRLIMELVEKTRLINRVLEKLDEIVEQTDLLALNAAIESYRAGEHGLGFAVVSDEVRKLAESSRVSMKDISGILNDIRTRSREIADQFVLGKNSIESGKEAMDGIENVFRQIAGHAGLMSQKSNQVEKMVHMLENSSAVISREMVSIAGTAEGIAQSVGLVFANIDSQSRKVAEILESFKELERLAGMRGMGNQSFADGQVAGR